MCVSVCVCVCVCARAREITMYFSSYALICAWSPPRSLTEHSPAIVAAQDRGGLTVKFPASLLRGTYPNLPLCHKTLANEHLCGHGKVIILSKKCIKRILAFNDGITAQDCPYIYGTGKNIARLPPKIRFVDFIRHFSYQPGCGGHYLAAATASYPINTFSIRSLAKRPRKPL